jgi:mono/diheme cytochrome c family protein
MNQISYKTQTECHWANAEGKASALLLQEQRINERLATLGTVKAKQRATELTKSLPPVGAKTAELIRQRLAGFARADASASRGLEVFKKNCAACHKLGDVGVMMARSWMASGFVVRNDYWKICSTRTATSTRHFALF